MGLMQRARIDKRTLCKCTWILQTILDIVLYNNVSSYIIIYVIRLLRVSVPIETSMVVLLYLELVVVYLYMGRCSSDYNFKRYN